MQLAGKVALVTGASQPRSIGWGIARVLALAGADVVLNDAYHPEDLAARAEALKALGRRALALVADVSDDAQVARMIARVLAELGRLDIAVSNAGVIAWERLFDMTPENTRRILRVNILGMVNVCRQAARAMVAQGAGGRLILVSSVQSDVQFPITPVYGASKHAMHNLVGSLALELAPHHITVNHIGPGWVRSPLNDRAPDQQTPEDIAAQRAAVPLGRAGLIEEMGEAVKYLASPEAAYVTGAFLRVDGGLGISKYN
jgi:NAD(P)-dependent dehydrogenase (short-subunit alcohol dehydrogenase family)